MDFPHKFTAEERAQGSETTKKREVRNRSWYMRKLLAIGLGLEECSATQLRSLQLFADQKGWHGPKNKRNAVSKLELNKMMREASKPKPAVSDDLMGRMAILLSQAEKPEQREQLRKEQA